MNSKTGWTHRVSKTLDALASLCLCRHPLLGRRMS
jgi:hypothetical protein